MAMEKRRGEWINERDTDKSAATAAVGAAAGYCPRTTLELERFCYLTGERGETGEWEGRARGLVGSLTILLPRYPLAHHYSGLPSVQRRQETYELGSPSRWDPGGGRCA